jgi:tetratricopeptide (TPR) repeat protein
LNASLKMFLTPHWPDGKTLNKEEITYLLKHPENISEQHQVALGELIEDFPFFQPAQALYLKVLKNQNSHRYNQQLKKTAAYTADRSVLFEFITSNVFTESTVSDAALEEPVLTTEEADKIELDKAEAILNPALFERKVEKTEQEKAVAEILEVHKPLPFSKDDQHSFNEWLKLTSAKPIQREEKPEKRVSQKEEKFRLIDKFLQENPKIDPTVQQSTEDLSKPFTKPNEHLMTETLAKVYIQQKNYKKAIQAYKILILKNPEKSGFFADQIRAIEKLQQNN